MLNKTKTVTQFAALFAGLSLITSLAIASPSEPPKRTAIVLNSGEASVSLIDMDKRAVYKTFPIGKEPHHLMITPDQKSVLVANAVGNDVAFLDPKTGELQGRTPNIIDPYHIGYSPDKKWFIAAGNRLDRVDIYAAKDRELKLVKVVKAPKTPSDKYLLVGLTGADSVQVIDWKNQKIIKEIKTGKAAHNFRPLGDKRHIFLTNRVESTISLLDMEKLEKVADITGLPAGPDCMDVTPDGKELWVTFRFSKKVGVIDIASRKLIVTIPVGKSPHGIFFYPSAGWQ